MLIAASFTITNWTKALFAVWWQQLFAEETRAAFKSLDNHCQMINAMLLERDFFYHVPFCLEESHGDSAVEFI
jgi:hypothetical protein